LMQLIVTTVFSNIKETAKVKPKKIYSFRWLEIVIFGIALKKQKEYWNQPQRLLVCLKAMIAASQIFTQSLKNYLKSTVQKQIFWI
jgi:hypothetical protein